MSIKPPVFKPKDPVVGPEIHYSERLKRVMRAHRDINFEYQLSTADIRNEKLFSVYAQRYPDMARSKLMTFMRVRVEPNMFELDEKGTLDSEHRVKEALVWSESRKVLNPENPFVTTETFIQSQILHGVYKRPFATTKLDEYGNPIENETRISGYRNVFWIPFDENHVNEVLERFGGKYRKTSIAFALQGEAWYQTPYFEIPNLTEWMSEPFDLLAEAAQIGTKEKKWLTEEWGGAQGYLQYKQDNRKEIMKKVSSSKK